LGRGVGDGERAPDGIEEGGQLRKNEVAGKTKDLDAVAA